MNCMRIVALLGLVPRLPVVPAAALAATATVAALAGPVGCKKDEPKLGAAECARINDHLVDLAVKEVLSEQPKLPEGVAGAGITAEDLKKELTKDPRNANIVADCEKSYTKPVYDCMMQATTTKTATACAPQ